MAQILALGLEDDLHRWLRERAARSGRSMEAEARAILARARAVGAVNPIERVIVEMRGVEAEPLVVPDQLEHEHTDFAGYPGLAIVTP